MISEYNKYKTKYLRLKYMDCLIGGVGQNHKKIKIIIVEDKTQVQKLSPWIDDELFNTFPNSKYCFLYCHKNECGINTNNDDYILIGQVSLQSNNNDIIHPQLFEPLGNRIYIWGLGIYPEFRGKGDGSAMLQLVLQDNFGYILLVRKSNQVAIKLYTKFGFVKYKPNKAFKNNNKQLVECGKEKKIIMHRKIISK